MSRVADKWIRRGALAQRVALNPIAEHARRAVNELTSDLQVARGALAQAATLEWCADMREAFARMNWSLLWRLPRTIGLRVCEALLAYDWRGLYEQFLAYALIVRYFSKCLTIFYHFYCWHK